MRKPPVRVYDWNEIPSRELKPGIMQRGFRSQGVLMTYNYIHPGAQGSPHSHPFDQIFLIIQGRVKLHVEDELFDLGPGNVVRIPPEYVHWVEPPSEEDGVAINVDIFGPARQDYLDIVAYQSDDFTNETSA